MDINFTVLTRGMKTVESNHARFLEFNMDNYRCSYIGDMTLKQKKDHCFYSSCSKKYHISL